MPINPKLLSKIAWAGLLGGGLSGVAGVIFGQPLFELFGLILIGVGFIAMCWLGGYALQDLRADQKDDTEAK